MFSLRNALVVSLKGLLLIFKGILAAKRCMEIGQNRLIY